VGLSTLARDSHLNAPRISSKGGAAYYLNDFDLWIWPNEVRSLLRGLTPQVISDSASQTAIAILLQAGFTQSTFGRSNGTLWVIGSQIAARSGDLSDATCAPAPLRSEPNVPLLLQAALVALQDSASSDSSSSLLTSTEKLCIIRSRDRTTRSPFLTRTTLPSIPDRAPERIRTLCPAAR
jgi:hypothetical protein